MSKNTTQQDLSTKENTQSDAKKKNETSRDLRKRNKRLEVSRNLPQEKNREKRLKLKAQQ